MTRAIRIGYQARPQHGSYDAMRASWIEAEALGVDAVYNWDHFYPLYDDPDGPHFECWTLIAALAEATSRVEVGALVTCMSYRNPNLLADMSRTIDHISDGRFTLGIGSGWFERDYTEYGYEFGTAPGRLKALERDLPTITERLGRLNPPPVGTLPILIGGSGRKVTLRLVAQYADAWNAFGPPENYAELNAVLDDWCDKVGRDRTAVERTVCINPDEVGNAEAYLEAGATHLIIMTSDPFALDAVATLVETARS